MSRDGRGEDERGFRVTGETLQGGGRERERESESKRIERGWRRHLALQQDSPTWSNRYRCCDRQSSRGKHMFSGFDPRPLLISRSGEDLLDDERGESRHDYGSIR